MSQRRPLGQAALSAADTILDRRVDLLLYRPVACPTRSHIALQAKPTSPVEGRHLAVIMPSQRDCKRGKRTGFRGDPAILRPPTRRLNGRRMIVSKHPAALAACLLALSLTGVRSEAQTANPTSGQRTQITHEKLWTMKSVGAPA